MLETLLYPRITSKRSMLSLDGMWKFSFDKEKNGNEKNWENGISDYELMPVPGSFADLFTEKEKKSYCGDFWYETEFLAPEVNNKRILIRFGAVVHRAVVYLNGNTIGEHEGGFLPFAIDITDKIKEGKNKLVLKVNNELNEESLPCGAVKKHKDGRLTATPYFDFFNYSGIQRSVQLVILPQTYIKDYSVDYKLIDNKALIDCHVELNSIDTDFGVKVALVNENKNLVLNTL